MDNSCIDWGYDTKDQLVSASRTNGPNGAADAAYSFSYSFDEVGNRTNEVRGQTELDGSFNALNQIRTLNWSGMLDVLGQIGTTNNNPFTVLVNASTATVYNVTNFLGGATLGAGSNSISIVTKDTVPTTNETVKTVFAPPVQPQAFTWDKNGCMTSDGYRDYTWNEECRLKEIETSSAAVTMGLPKRKSVFVYDGLGRRCKRTDYSGWNGSDYGTTNVTKYVWDGFNILAELNEDNSIKSYMVWGLDVSQSLQGAGGVGGLLAMTMGSTNYFYTYCGNGNVTDVLDDQGTVVAHYERDPFGRIVKQTGSFAIENPWGFSTKMFDRVWGIVEFELRPTYSPELGKFLSRDPLGEWGVVLLHLCPGLFDTPVPALGEPLSLEDTLDLSIDEMHNMYLFVDNSPNSNTDPLGLVKRCTFVADSFHCRCPYMSTKGTRHNKAKLRISNGCSVPPLITQLGFDRNNPMGDCSFEGPCDNHDCCYSTCHRNNKRACDKDFLKDMKAACKKCAEDKKLKGWSKYKYMKACKEFAGAYHRMVKLFGGPAWRQNQKEYCESCCCHLPIIVIPTP